MKRSTMGVAALLTAMMIGGAVPALAYTESASGKSSSELAALYEQRAQDQETVIAEHREMMESAKRRFDPPKAQVKRNKQMVRHCQRIINAAGALRDEYRDLAEWHREHAEAHVEE